MDHGSHGLNASAFGNRSAPKDNFRISGAAYKALGMSDKDVGQSVRLVIEGTIKAKSESHLEEGIMDFVVRVDELKDITPRQDRDETGRILI